MKRIISSIILSLAILSVYAYSTGYVYTPNGTSIELCYYDEMSADDISYCNTYYPEQFPNATFVSTATATYNCHAYAWHISEGGSTCWINAPLEGEYTGYNNLKKYWTDGSYRLTIEENATKVHYYISDHSAVIKEPGSVYISKWGAGPLMEHAPEYGPYYNMDSRKYYNRSDDFVTSILAPGYGNYVRNHEYEFFTVDDIEGKYIYMWTISEEEDDGRDAVELGKATFDNSEKPSVAKITFLTGGLYHVTVEIYTGDDEFVSRSTCQAYVL